MFTNRRRFTSVLISVFLLGCFSGCKRFAAKKQAQAILTEIGALQAKEDEIVLRIAKRPLVFSDESLDGFPKNRDSLRLIAIEQIDDENLLIDLENTQIGKFELIQGLPLDERFLKYSALKNQAFVLRREQKEVAVQKFALIFDPTITSNQVLRDRFFELNDKSTLIDVQIKETEEQSIRIRSGLEM